MDTAMNENLKDDSFCNSQPEDLQTVKQMTLDAGEHRRALLQKDN